MMSLTSAFCIKKKYKTFEKSTHCIIIISYYITKFHFNGAVLVYAVVIFDTEGFLVVDRLMPLWSLPESPASLLLGHLQYRSMTRHSFIVYELVVASSPRGKDGVYKYIPRKSSPNLLFQ